MVKKALLGFMLLSVFNVPNLHAGVGDFFAGVATGFFSGYYVGYSPAARVTLGNMAMVNYFGSLPIGTPRVVVVRGRGYYRPASPQPYWSDGYGNPVPPPVSPQPRLVFRDREGAEDIPTEMTFVNGTPYLVSVFINGNKKFDLLPDGKQTILVPRLLGTRIQGVAARERENDLVLIFDRYNLKPQKDGDVITFTKPPGE